MTPQEIKDVLDKSGYLFEQKVASLIESLGFHTMTNRAFLDPEENKSREIDVHAHKKVFEIENNPKIEGLCYLNCECKNSTTPYVFITRKKGLFEKYYKPDGIFLLDTQTGFARDGNIYTIVEPFHYHSFDKIHFATNTDSQAVQICKIVQNGNKKEAQHSGVIEGFIYPLIKSNQIWQPNSPQNDNKTKYCKFFFNLAIVNSKLYTIDSHDENALPIEKGFVPFIRDVQTKELQGKFLITFVTYDYLKTFIEKNIYDFYFGVYKTYMDNPDLLVNLH